MQESNASPPPKGRGFLFEVKKPLKRGLSMIMNLNLDKNMIFSINFHYLNQFGFEKALLLGKLIDNYLLKERNNQLKDCYCLMSYQELGNLVENIKTPRIILRKEFVETGFIEINDNVQINQFLYKPTPRCRISKTRLKLNQIMDSVAKNKETLIGNKNPDITDEFFKLMETYTEHEIDTIVAKRMKLLHPVSFKQFINNKNSVFVFREIANPEKTMYFGNDQNILAENFDFYKYISFYHNSLQIVETINAEKRYLFNYGMGFSETVVEQKSVLKRDRVISTKNVQFQEKPVAKKVTGLKPRIMVDKKQQLANVPNKKVFQYKQIPSEIEELLSYWVELGMKLPKRETKTFTNTVKLLKQLLAGTLYSRFTLGNEYKEYLGTKITIIDVQTTFEKFADAALDPNYDPAPGAYKNFLSKMRLEQFLYNTHGKGETFLFLKYLLYSPEELNRNPMNKYPEITKLLKDKWQKIVYRGSGYVFNEKENKVFIALSNKVTEYAEMYSVNTVRYGGGNAQVCVDALFKFCVRYYGQYLPSAKPVFLLNNENIWNVHFRIFLEDNDYIEKREVSVDFSEEMYDMDKDFYFGNS